jgi:hypothetical protein
LAATEHRSVWFGIPAAKPQECPHRVFRSILLPEPEVLRGRREVAQGVRFDLLDA